MFWRRRPERAPPHPRARRALIAHEYGAGQTHVSHVLNVTRHLRAAGIECLVALYDNRADRAFAAFGVHTVQSFMWPGWRRDVSTAHQRPDRSMLDLLANHGFAQPDWLAAAIGHYDALFSLFAPDIVLAENAHGALLAARDRVPTIAFGSRHLLPPVVDGRFPVFEAWRPESSWSDEELLAGVNEGLARGGRIPLRHVTDILDVDAVLPFGPAALDVYDGLRSEPVLPVHVRGYSPGLRAGSGDEVFVYLQGFAPRLPAVMAALLSLRRPIRAFIQDVEADDRAILAEHGVALEEGPVPIPAILERSRCVLHHGGSGLLAACLAAGLPQVLLSKELDNQVTGEYVSGRGLARERWLWHATTSWIVDSLRRATDDEEYRAFCRASAPEFDSWFGPDPTATVAREACRILGVDPPIRRVDVETSGPSEAAPPFGRPRLERAHARARARRALIAHEYGAGQTHVSHVLNVTRHLRAAGVECLVALHDNRADRAFAALGVHTVQNFVWPGWRRNAPDAYQRPDRSMLDLLANFGVSQPDWLAAAIGHYDALFSLFEPDIVLAENAHGALLAARDRVPTIAFGFGQLLPPVVDGRFPVFEASRPDASWSDAELLAGINANLARAGRAPLTSITDILKVDRVLPFGPAAFDPYGGMRPSPSLSVHVKGFRPGRRAGSGDEVFVYLQSFAARLPAVMAALLSLRRPIRAFVQDIVPEDRATLAAGGVVLEAGPIPIPLLLERSRCVLHHGGTGLVPTCLAAGLPQVILSKELDNQVAGHFVEGRNLARARWLWDATTSWIVDEVRRAYDDEDYRAFCRASAPEFDSWFGPDPTAIVAREACRLIGIDPSAIGSDDLEGSAPAGTWNLGPARPGAGREPDQRAPIAV